MEDSKGDAVVDNDIDGFHEEGVIAGIGPHGTEHLDRVHTVCINEQMAGFVCEGFNSEEGREDGESLEVEN